MIIMMMMMMMIIIIIIIIIIISIIALIIIKTKYGCESDLRNNEHYLSSSENNAWKKVQSCAGFELMTSAKP